MNSGSRATDFRNAIRRRDQKCVFLSEEQVNIARGYLISFKAAQIFLLAYQEHWCHKNDCYGLLYLSDTGGPVLVNLVQSVLLLRTDLHALFNRYHLSMNRFVKTMWYSGVGDFCFGTACPMWKGRTRRDLLTVKALIRDTFAKHELHSWI